MANGFFDYLYGAAKSKAAETNSPEEKPVGDEAIVRPWTHKVTIYCANPSETFVEELQSKDGVVAVYIKEKTEPAKEIPPNETK